MDQLLEVVLEDSSSKTKCVIKSIQCVSTVLCYFLRATKTLPTVKVTSILFRQGQSQWVPQDICDIPKAANEFTEQVFHFLSLARWDLHLEGRGNNDWF